MRLLELFSGTKSVGRAFEALGWEVTSLDADATTRPSICADIREWDYRTYPPGHFDLIWASPVCMPPRLCREIAESLNGKGEALPHRRIHLETATRPDRPPRAVHRHLPGAEQIREDGGADLSHPGSVHDGRR